MRGFEKGINVEKNTTYNLAHTVHDQPFISPVSIGHISQVGKSYTGAIRSFLPLL